MRRSHNSRHGWAIVVLGTLASWAGGEDAAPPASRPATSPTTSAATRPALATDLAVLVAGLSSADAAERAKSAQALEAVGERARPALVVAVNGEDVNARLAATPLLMRLPFDRPQDPDEVRALLKDYGRGSPEARRGIAVKLATRAQAIGVGVLHRLLVEDPSDEVRWAIVGQLRRLGPGTYTATQPRQDVNRAPNLALAGLSFLTRDRDVAVALMERAVELDAKQPAQAVDMSLTYYDLAVQYVQRRRYDDAAELHRRAFARSPSVRIHRGSDIDSFTHLQLLFHLHARYGPLKGLDDDVAAYARLLAGPSLQYPVGRIYELTGQRMLAETFYRAGFCSTADTPAAHYEVGRFLERMSMPSQAEQQYEAAASGGDGLDASPAALNARIQLAMMTSWRGQDFQAAERMRTLLSFPMPKDLQFSWGGRGREGRDARAELEAMMHWHYLRAARDKNDANSVKAHLKELVRLNPDSSDIAVDAVPLLQTAGQDADATRMFAAAYDRARADLDLHPDDPVKMDALAWLCARCGQHLDEALKLSTAAVAAQPNNGAFADTAAEAHFRLGHVEEAIRLETRAIELMPTRATLHEQLKRFKAKRDDEGKSNQP